MLVRGSRPSSEGFSSRYWQSELRGLPLSFSFLHTILLRYLPPARCLSRHRWPLRYSTSTTIFSRQCTLPKTACPNSSQTFHRSRSRPSSPRRMSDSSVTEPSISAASLGDSLSTHFSGGVFVARAHSHSSWHVRPSSMTLRLRYHAKSRKLS